MQVVLIEKLGLSLKEANRLTLRQLIAYMNTLKAIHTQDETPQVHDETKLTVNQARINEINRKSQELARQQGKM